MIAGVLVRHKVLVNRMRSIAFALLILALLVVKMTCKAVVVWPSAKAFGLSTRESSYTTLLMSTGLTFGTISALYGLTNGIIKQTQSRHDPGDRRDRECRRADADRPDVFPPT